LCPFQFTRVHGWGMTENKGSQDRVKRTGDTRESSVMISEKKKGAGAGSIKGRNGKITQINEETIWRATGSLGVDDGHRKTKGDSGE